MYLPSTSPFCGLEIGELIRDFLGLCVLRRKMLNEKLLGRQGTYQFLAFVPLGPHCSEPLPRSLLFTITLLVQALERRIEALLKVMYWLVLLLESLDVQMKVALSSFDIGIVALGFHVFHKWKDDVHEGDLESLGLDVRAPAGKILYLSLELLALVEALDIAFEHRIAILKCLEF